jgi:hypothetical protein
MPPSALFTVDSSPLSTNFIQVTYASLLFHGKNYVSKRCYNTDPCVKFYFSVTVKKYGLTSFTKLFTIVIHECS